MEEPGNAWIVTVVTWCAAIKAAIDSLAGLEFQARGLPPSRLRSFPLTGWPRALDPISD